ncbi:MULTISPECIES: hypothetical protein [Gracilibacillus]|uniref:Uncharacterized protein n=1 Tax=Gracilibacillus dipsosauri TaxID=178340 RepID=A0A317KYU0_9BACI|nr:hypothetical protein [Gracilibacillus dipsosauri]PWU68722.1 hypothetical protein DLJ74_09860 [Gracilibacillus dipsosauri]
MHPHGFQEPLHQGYHYPEHDQRFFGPGPGFGPLGAGLLGFGLGFLGGELIDGPPRPYPYAYPPYPPYYGPTPYPPYGPYGPYGPY